MRIHQTLTESEYRAGGLYMMKQQAKEPKWIVLMIGFVLIMFAAMFFFASERFSLAVGLFFGVAAVPLMARYSIRKTFRDPANANMFVPRDYELTETSLSATTEFGTTRMSWSSFTQVVELPTVIVMQETKLSAVMIGTGQLTKMQLQELRQLLRLHFPDAKLGEGIG